MLTSLTNILTLLTFVVHAILGCCIHHAHGPASDIDQPQVASAAAHQHSCPYHAHSCSRHVATTPLAAADESVPAPDHNSVPCDDDRCWLVCEQSVRVDSADLLRSGTEFCWSEQAGAVCAAPPAYPAISGVGTLASGGALAMRACLQSWRI